MGQKEQSIKQRRLSYRLYPSRSATSPLHLSRGQMPFAYAPDTTTFGKESKIMVKKVFCNLLSHDHYLHWCLQVPNK
jgi:hypothetical protein